MCLYFHPEQLSMLQNSYLECLLLVAQCPVNDLLTTAQSRGIFQTMSTSAFLTVKVISHVCVQARTLGSKSECRIHVSYTMHV